MTTDELIKNLSRDVTAVAPAPKTRMLAAFLFSAMATLVALEIACVGGRSDLWEALADGWLPATGLFLILSCALLTVAVTVTAFPGRSDHRFYFWIAGLLYALVGLALFARPLFGIDEVFRDGISLAGLPCARDTLVLSLAPALLLFQFLRRRAVTRPVLAGLLVGVTSGLFAGLALQLCCASNHGIHQLAWHLILPVWAAGALGALAGPRLFRW